MALGVKTSTAVGGHGSGGGGRYREPEPFLLPLFTNVLEEVFSEVWSIREGRGVAPQPCLLLRPRCVGILSNEDYNPQKSPDLMLAQLLRGRRFLPFLPGPH